MKSVVSMKLIPPFIKHLSCPSFIKGEGGSNYVHMFCQCLFVFLCMFMIRELLLRMLTLLDSFCFQNLSPSQYSLCTVQYHPFFGAKKTERDRDFCIFCVIDEVLYTSEHQFYLILLLTLHLILPYICCLPLFPLDLIQH